MNKHRVVIYNYVNQSLKFTERVANSYDEAVALAKNTNFFSVMIYNKDDVLVAKSEIDFRTNIVDIVQCHSDKPVKHVPGLFKHEPDISNGKVVQACEANLGDVWCSIRYYIGRAIKESVVVNLSRIVIRDNNDLPKENRRIDISDLLERVLAMYGDLASNIKLVDDEAPNHCNFAAKYRSQPIQLVEPYRWHGQESNYITYQLVGSSNPEEQNVPIDEQKVLFDLAEQVGLRTMVIGLPMTLEESTKAIAGSRLFVGCDSAMAHIAYSVGTPTFIHRGQFFNFDGWLSQTQYNAKKSNRLMKMRDITKSPDWLTAVEDSNSTNKEKKMYGVVTFNLANYTSLAEITDAAKMEYCDRHGYKFFPLRELKYSPVMGFNKIHYMLDLFKQHPDLEWLLFSECDAMITNFIVRIENRIDNNFHIIVPVDVNNVNSGNLLARNSKEGREYLQMILDNEPRYASHVWAEQQVIIDTYKNYPNVVKIVPQRYMNSYEMMYPPPHRDIRTDMLGNPAIWEPGDWIVHWPGLLLNVRVYRARELTKLIVK